MGIVICPDCGGKVSDRLKACPHCGCPCEYLYGESGRGRDSGTIVTFKDKLMFKKDDLCVGGIISMGRYPQGEHGEELPLEWIVLSMNQQDALLISKNIIDFKNFNYLSTSKKWNSSSIRGWLNSQFIATAFTTIEQEQLKNSDILCGVANPKSQNEDKVFLLTEIEFERFNDIVEDPNRSDYFKTVFPDSEEWMLRDSKDRDEKISYAYGSCVFEYDLYSNHQNETGFGVRPAIRILLQGV